jgi:beta-glucosidase-like glycosyl hydrolase
MPAVFTSSDRATSRLIRHYVEDLKVGGIVWLKGDTLSLITLKPEIDSVARLPLFMAIDAETGLGMRLDGEEVMPAMHYLATASEDSLYDIGVSVGSRARHLGLNMVLGPVLDVAPSRSSVMWRRSISGAPDVVGDLGCGYARGLHDGGVMPVAKHFPGHGATNRDSHQVTPIVNKSAEEFTAQDLLPFKEYVDRRLGGVMVGHLAVPSLGGDSIPATFSHRLVSELLRGEMGFKGLVISDAMNMGGAKSAGDSPYVRALQAGVDIIMAPTDTNEAIEQIRLGLESGELETATLRQAVARIIYCKLILGLMPNE